MDTFEDILRDPEISEYLHEFPTSKWEEIIKTGLRFGISSLKTTESILVAEDNAKKCSNDIESIKSDLERKDKRKQRRSFTYSTISEIYHPNDISVCKLHKPNTLKNNMFYNVKSSRTNTKILEKSKKQRDPVGENSFQEPHIFTSIFNSFNSIFQTQDALGSKRQYKQNLKKYGVYHKNNIGGNTQKDKKKELGRIRNLRQRSMSEYGLL